MPDWSYQTLFRPLFFRMEPRKAQQFAIGALGRLGTLPGGRNVIAFMGHMIPDRNLAFEFGGVRFPSRVGLAAGLDSLGGAKDAFSQFGFAFLEYGPLTEEGCRSSTVEFDVGNETIRLHSPEQNPGVGWLSHLEQETDGPSAIDSPPLFARFDATISPETVRSQLANPTPGISGFVVPKNLWNAVCQTTTKRPVEQRPICLLLVSSDDPPADINIDDLPSPDGVFIDGGISSHRSHRVLSRDNLTATCQATQVWRERLGADRLIVATGGVHQPIDAIAVSRAGADIVAVDSGMVVAGPGLAKRCNELLAQTTYRSQAKDSHPHRVTGQSDRPARQSWFWAMLMGISMLGGGLLALAIAMTRVVLPYDEATVGMTRAELMQVNDRLIDFMAHDRVTLAGTMLSVGTLYAGLAIFGMRYGAHWAGKSIIVSAFVGFFSFFLFLGFGYFDPFHAFVTAILFQFLLLTVYANLADRRHPVRLDLYNDGLWRRAQWGQLMYLLQGVALIVAGVVISAIGITSVFVKEDMEFLCTTPDRLIAANPQLLSLVAHDRATFGGMLICAGITVLLAALWGFRRGHTWLSWTLFASGLFGYLCTIVIHHKVGYVDVKHLAPAYGGLVWLCIAAKLSFPFLSHRVTRLPKELC